MNMTIRTTYFVFCLLGFAFPYSQFIPWVLERGLDVPLFWGELFSNRIGGFFGMDVIVSACVLTLFVFVEGRRLGMQRLWVPIVGTFLVGVSFGLPLFLYMRHPYTLEPNNAFNTDAPKRRAG
jgi:hypothetical protein